MQRRRSMPHTFEENIAAENSRAMGSIPPPADAQEYLESLMRAGQDAMKQFVDALRSAAGVRTEESLSSGRPLFPDRRPSARTSQAGMALLEGDVPSDIFRRSTCGRCPGQGGQAVQGRI